MRTTRSVFYVQIFQREELLQSFQRGFLKSTGGSCPIPPAQYERVEIEEEGEKIEEKSFLERVGIC